MHPPVHHSEPHNVQTNLQLALKQRCQGMRAHRSRSSAGSAAGCRQLSMSLLDLFKTGIAAIQLVTYLTKLCHFAEGQNGKASFKKKYSAIRSTSKGSCEGEEGKQQPLAATAAKAKPFGCKLFTANRSEHRTTRIESLEFKANKLDKLEAAWLAAEEPEPLRGQAQPIP